MKAQDKKCNPMQLLAIAVIVLTHGACSQSGFLSTQVGQQKENEFTSVTFNHFEGGVLFAVVQTGLDILWNASFKGRNVYRENLGFFLKDGLLITPNNNNTSKSASLAALKTKVEDGKLYVNFAGTFTEVLGIIHTHPDSDSLPVPSPRNDYQYCNLGIHNYIMDRRNLFDAYKDRKGREVYKRLGPRNAYDKLPFCEVMRVSKFDKSNHEND